MKVWGLFGLVVWAAGCGATAPAETPRPSDEKENYVILDESERFWIVKVWKRGGPNAADSAAKALRNESPPDAIPAQSEGPDTGRVQGRVARNGEAVPGCKLKLTPMGRNLGVLQWEEGGGAEPAAVTDASGAFLFRAVPAGAYRLKWLVPGTSHWIKKLKEVPDVIVEAGKTATAADVDVSRPAR